MSPDHLLTLTLVAYNVVALVLLIRIVIDLFLD